MLFSDYEYHLNYDIAFNLFQQYNITNNATWFNNGPRQVIESAAIMTGQLLKFNETTQTYWLHNMTDPDEYANGVDNGAFTIASAADLLKQANALRVSQGLPINETWQDQYERIAFPRAPSNITLEYQTMNNSVAVKQADVVLLTYPLDYAENYTASDKLLDLDYVSYLELFGRNQ
jgi:trehalose/maltose hydrolase-like predicted phosphorylase